MTAKRVIKGATAGPYSPAVLARGLCFLAGQTGHDYATGALPDGVEAQTKAAMDKLGAILDQAGLGFGDVLRCGVYLTDMADFQAMNAVYAPYFPEDPPARTTIGVAQLPGGALVEIDCLARAPDRDQA